jgi:hypothetical protein
VADDAKRDLAALARRSWPGLLICGVLLAVVPACSSTSTPSAAPTTTSVTAPNQNPAAIAACTTDAKVVEVALAAYDASKGAYPSPPSSWSAATYLANYQPLLSAGGGGPYMAAAPRTTSYVIEYDSAGHAWVSPPGSYGTYDKAQDIDVSPDICDAAVG